MSDQKFDIWIYGIFAAFCYIFLKFFTSNYCVHSDCSLSFGIYQSWFNYPELLYKSATFNRTEASKRVESYSSFDGSKRSRGSKSSKPNIARSRNNQVTAWFCTLHTSKLLSYSVIPCRTWAALPILLIARFDHWIYLTLRLIYISLFV